MTDDETARDDGAARDPMAGPESTPPPWRPAPPAWEQPTGQHPTGQWGDSGAAWTPPPQPYAGTYAAGGTGGYPTPYGPLPPATSDRTRRTWGGAAIAAGVVAAALVGGGAGAVVEHHYGSNTTRVVSALAQQPAHNAARQAPAGSVQQVAAQVLPSVVSITVATQGSGDEGTGIVLTSDGEILTNNHVVAAAAGGAGTITVTLNTERSVSGRIVGRDPITDLAVVKAAGVSNLTPATIGRSSDLAVGQAVVAVGSPLGLSGTVTSGIVSALNRPVQTANSEQQPPLGQGGRSQSAQATVIDAVQTDAAINPGNSGGPLVNMSGQVVGINSAIASLGSAAQSGGQSGSIGVGFAIPIDEARPIVKQLADGQTATHAQLAVTVTDRSSSTGVGAGALLRTVEASGPARTAGLRGGDVIAKLDGRPIDSAESLIAAVRSHRPGDKVTVTYTSSGSQHTTTVTLGSDR